MMNSLQFLPEGTYITLIIHHFLRNTNVPSAVKKSCVKLALCINAKARLDSTNNWICYRYAWAKAQFFGLQSSSKSTYFPFLMHMNLSKILEILLNAEESLLHALPIYVAWWNITHQT
jgi:hypothetical protein